MPAMATQQPKAKNIKPFGKRVVIVPAKPKEQTDSGILLPEDAQHPSIHGTVIAVGPDVPTGFYEGQKVIFPQYAGVEMVLDDGVHEEVTVLIMDYTQLTAEIEEAASDVGSQSLGNPPAGIAA